MSSLRLPAAVLLCAVALATAGCHNLKPSELWKLNRYPAPSHDQFFSVDDPIPEYDRQMADSGVPEHPAARPE
jgi:hypothetical protein